MSAVCAKDILQQDHAWHLHYIDFRLSPCGINVESITWREGLITRFGLYAEAHEG